MLSTESTYSEKVAVAVGNSIVFLEEDEKKSQASSIIPRNLSKEHIAILRTPTTTEEALANATNIIHLLKKKEVITLCHQVDTIFKECYPQINDGSGPILTSGYANGKQAFKKVLISAKKEKFILFGDTKEVAKSKGFSEGDYLIGTGCSKYVFPVWEDKEQRWLACAVIAIHKDPKNNRAQATEECTNATWVKDIKGFTKIHMQYDTMLIEDWYMRGNLADASLSEREKWKVAKWVIRAMDKLHAKRILHGDIKPQNIVIEGEEESLKVAICDLGQMRKLDEADGRDWGTPCFYPPEAASRRVNKEIPMLTFAADVWMVGEVLYTMFIGKLPWSDSSKADIFLNIAKLEEDWFSEPKKDTIQHLIWQMMCVDPIQRITMDNVYKQLRSIYPYKKDMTTRVTTMLRRFTIQK